MNGWDASDTITHRRIEAILRKHGVGSHDEEVAKGPRSCRAIQAIINDLRARNKA